MDRKERLFLEEAAMIDDEGSWEIPNIMDVNPDLADHVVQGRVPITDDASKTNFRQPLSVRPCTRTARSWMRLRSFGLPGKE